MKLLRKRGGSAPLPKAFRPTSPPKANRKIDRGEPAAEESSPRKVEERADPHRKPVGAAIRICAAVVATGLTMWAGASAYQKATTAEYFAVTEIHVSGNARLSESEVVRAAGIERGVNIFRVDVDEICRNLEKEPWVLDARAERELPRGLAISIVERKLEALALFEVPYLVDDSGVLFKRWAPGDPMPAPVISGLSREKLADDADAVQSDIDDAIALTRQYRAAGLDRVAPLAEVHSEIDGGFSLTVGSEPFYVRFGKGPYRQKIDRLASLMRRLRADGEKPEVVYFDNEIRPDRVTVKMRPRPGESAEGAVEITRAQ
jgi:cell division protein FtsQ